MGAIAIVRGKDFIVYSRFAAVKAMTLPPATPCASLVGLVQPQKSASEEAALAAPEEAPVAAVIHLPDEASTRSLGKAIARRCKAAMAVLLYGPLGAGKTTFAQGFVGELTGERATSPTFVIAHRHAGRPASVWHLDLYRLSDAEMCADIDLDSYLDVDSIAIVEWPERAGAYAWPPDRIEIRLSLQKQGRAADLQARGRCAPILDSVLTGWASAPD